MATIAVVAAGNMLTRFAAGHSAIMATDTTAVHLVVIHRAIGHRTPGRRKLLVAGITVIAPVYMGCGYTTGDAAVVAADAIANKGTMIRRGSPGHGEPGCTDMASITFLYRDHMPGTLATGQGAVMATGTTTDGLGVISGAGR